jgi:Uncharacterized protein conserved in bacteria
VFADFAKFNHGCLLAALLLIWPCLAPAEPASRDDCRPLQTVDQQQEKPLAYANALLWKISKDGLPPSYLFGTIHVADERITALPAPVRDALNTAGVFVMEALPDPEENMRLTKMMYFDDGKTLRDYLDEELYQLTTDILDEYPIALDSILFMKPWAAFIIMSYPLDQGMPLDLQLLDIARRNGVTTRGLETLSEQGRVFSSLDIETQVSLLLETVCNYDLVSREFETMKSLYLQRDLHGLYLFSRKYSPARGSHKRKTAQEVADGS